MNRKLIKNKRNILREFDKEKYGNLLEKINDKTDLTKCEEILNNFDNFDKTFFKKSLKNKKIINEFIYKYSKNSSTIVECGCGYGSIGLYLLNSNRFKKKNLFF